MKAVEQTLRRPSKSELEEVECLLGWAWVGLMGRRITMNHRILQPERISIILLILQIRKLTAQKCEGEMRPPSSRNSHSPWFIRGSSAAVTEHPENTVASRVVDINFFSKEATQFSPAVLLLVNSQEPKSSQVIVHTH